MPAGKEDEKRYGSEAGNSNVEVHIKLLKDNLFYFGCDFDDWEMCLISENCSTNRKISADKSEPLVGCLNHKFNLKDNSMIGSMPKCQKQLDTVHGTIKSA